MFLPLIWLLSQPLLKESRKMPEKQSSCRRGPGVTSFDLVGVCCPNQDMAQLVLVCQPILELEPITNINKGWGHHSFSFFFVIVNICWGGWPLPFFHHSMPHTKCPWAGSRLDPGLVASLSFLTSFYIFKSC